MKQKERKELHTKNIDELKKQASELNSTLFANKMDRAKNKLKDTKSLTRVRKDIARVLTIIRQKEKETSYGKNA